MLHLNLECRKQEISSLINTVRDQLGIDDEGPSLTVTNVVDLIFGPPSKRFASKFYKLLHKRLISITRNENNPGASIKAWEIEAFVESILLLHIIKFRQQYYGNTLKLGGIRSL